MSSWPPSCTRPITDWAADFCSKAPEHLAALACIPNHDPEEAVTELRRAAKLGLRGADFGVSTACKPIYHGAWDVLWDAAAECNMPVSFHAAGSRTRQPDPEDAQSYGRTAFAVSLSMMHMAGGEYLASIILSGACDRHPDFKFVLGECGVSWIPHLLVRLDDRYEDQFRELGLSMLPSEFWRRQGYSTYQDDAIVADIVDLVGVDKVMWSSDFPHPDGVWPDSRQGHRVESSERGPGDSIQGHLRKRREALWLHELARSLMCSGSAQHESLINDQRL